MGKNRVKEIDIAKGIGIMLVIAGHCLATDSFLRSVIYSFHMPLFFFLSGMVLKRHDSVKRSFDFKLLSYYIAFSLIYISFDIVFRWGILKVYSLKSILLDVYLTATFYGINVLWFLSTLLVAKVAVCVIEKRFLLNCKKRMAVSAVLFTFGGG